MPISPVAIKLFLLAPLALIVIYYDVRYRRIPNVAVLATLLAGFAVNTIFGGLQGTLASLYGFALAFFPMLIMHIFGAMGAGDVKLFGAVGAVLGIGLVPVTFILVVMIGGALAVYSMVRSDTVFTTLHGVLRIFVGILPGWEMPRFKMAPDRKHTIPYGVAIMLGSVLATVVSLGR
ncbi:MAG TPA: A24 family peptidase [Pyrinomonadaceae bacterium]|nr:A24 family peptidase [Pyrinomonadaceae bacterium]